MVDLISCFQSNYTGKSVLVFISNTHPYTSTLIDRNSEGESDREKERERERKRKRKRKREREIHTYILTYIHALIDT